MTAQTHPGRMNGDATLTNAPLTEATFSDQIRYRSFNPTDYGKDHDHKPTKAIVGVAIMIAIGFVLYEFNGKSADQHVSSAPTTQEVASSNR